MSILTVRSVKGTELTEAEHDNNHKAATLRIENVAELITKSGDFDNQTVNLAGYYAQGDGGGQLLYWDATSTETPNDGTIFQVTGVTTGRWKSVDTSIINVKMFGAKVDGSTDDYASIQAAINYSASVGGSVYMGAGVHAIGATISIPIKADLIGVYGASAYQEVTDNIGTEIKWIGASGGGVVSTAAGWARRLENIYINGNLLANNGLVMNEPNGGSIKNISLRNGKTGTSTGLLLKTSGGSTAVNNTFDKVIVSDNWTVGGDLSGEISGATVLRAVTFNLFLNCRFNATSVSLKLTQAADTNTFNGGRIETPSGGFGVQLNSGATNAGVFSNYFIGVAVDGPPSGAGTSVYTVNNAYKNYFIASGIYVNGASTRITMATGAKLKLLECYRGGGTPDDEYENISTITVGASPYIYANSSYQAEEVTVYGGTVSDIGINRNGLLVQVATTTDRTFTLQPDDTLVVTYSVAPTMKSVPH